MLDVYMSYKLTMLGDMLQALSRFPNIVPNYEK